MSRRKLPVFLQDSEPEQLLRATTRERDRVLLMALLYLGLRVSEACKLRVEHVDVGRAILFVREGKGAKDRALPIPRRFAGPLRGWIGSRISGYVWPSPGGGKLTSRAVQLLIKRVARRAKLPNADQPRAITPHKLRHAFASRMLERGNDINAVKEALGHSSISTTATYLHTSGERLRRAMEI